MNEKEILNPCPFCGGEAYLAISDDEGNMKNDDYEFDPWSGLSFKIQHGYQENKDCPIAMHDDDGAPIGVYLYDSREEAAQAWNKRI